MTASFFKSPAARTKRPAQKWGMSHNASPTKPCQACGKPDWCTYDADYNWLLCRRSAGANQNPLGWELVKNTAQGNLLFVRTDAITTEADYSHVDLSVRPEFKEDDKDSEETPPAPAAAGDRPVQLYHQVYTDFLAALRVSKRQQKELTDPAGKRRLTLAEVQAMGVKTLPVDRLEVAGVLAQLGRKYGIEKLCQVPGFYADKQGRLGVNAKPGSLLIPAHDGHTVTGMEVATDIPGKKYIRLTSASAWLKEKGIDGPKGWQRAALYMPIQGVRKPGVIGITEGAFKAFIAAQKIGIPFIAVPGVSNWRLGALDIALEKVGKGGKITIFYDSDASSNPNVEQARNSLADALALSGFTVEVATWGTEHKGIDDLLLAGGDFTTTRHTLGLGGIKVDQVITEQYLTNISLNKKVTLIRSAKNTGKTEAMAQLVSILPPHATVKVIGHRQALLGEAARRLHAEFYQDFKKARIDRKGLTNSARLAICADSLVHFDKPTQTSYIILDEVEQVLRHLTGATIKKRRQGVLAMFEALLKLADHVIGLDADLSGTTYRYFERLLGAENIEVIVNDFVQNRSVKMLQYGSQNEIVAALLEAAKSGKKCFVATNNKAEAQRLERVFEKELPELKVLCVHQDNSGSPEIHRVISNLKLTAQRFDVLIASPTLGTGIDINVKHFEETFLIGTHNSTNHSDLLQHMARNRQAELIHAYVAPGERFEPTDPAFWEKQCIDKYHETGLNIGYSLETGERLVNPADLNYLKLWADIRAADKASHNRLAANFFEQAAREGYQVQPAYQDQGNAFNIENNDENQGSEAIEAGKKRAAAAHELEQERREAILAAPSISNREAEELEAKAYLPKPQRARLERHRINHFYNLPVDAALVEIDNRGQTMPRLNEFMMFTGQIDTVERDRAIFDDAESMVPDARHYTLRRELRAEALAAAGVDLDSSFTPGQLASNGFIEWGLANKDRIYSVLGLTVKSDFEGRPVELLSAIFRQLNIKLQSRQLGKREERERVYTIDKESARLMWRLAKARLEGLEKHSSRLDMVA
jgi:hypothetical protein